MKSNIRTSKYIYEKLTKQDRYKEFAEWHSDNRTGDVNERIGRKGKYPHEQKEKEQIVSVGLHLI